MYAYRHIVAYPGDAMCVLLPQRRAIWVDTGHSPPCSWFDHLETEAVATDLGR
jgi:hypothetical protein